MAQPGSAFKAASKERCDARYQNECWKSIARSNAAAAFGVQDVSKWTLPKVSTAGWATAGWPMKRPAEARADDSIASDFMAALQSDTIRSAAHRAACQDVRPQSCGSAMVEASTVRTRRGSLAFAARQPKRPG